MASPQEFVLTFEPNRVVVARADEAGFESSPAAGVETARLVVAGSPALQPERSYSPLAFRRWIDGLIRSGATCDIIKI